ncbi:hypothetical protein WOLCODRAFT_21423 [Wolfiporia cocos MD-104 SS10]|uniref:Transmembrane protein n=1 Tax=Wolfiporia cocos (strain MD-104) TaxID=742152 RepID=A0A2H3JTC2_WOLCO|nr:hypothetical protein WOLCODRAFT_21423 [Wolfiporia cocos MD-104 SS10]
MSILIQMSDFSRTSPSRTSLPDPSQMEASTIGEETMTDGTTIFINNPNIVCGPPLRSGFATSDSDVSSTATAGQAPSKVLQSAKHVSISVAAAIFAIAANAFLGFMAMTAGQAALATTRPHNWGHVDDAHLIMQIGAVGGAILAAGLALMVICTLALMSLAKKKVDLQGRWCHLMRNRLVTSVCMVTYGAALGPLGVVVVRRCTMEHQTSILDYAQVAEAGAFGMFMLEIVALLYGPSDEQH